MKNKFISALLAGCLTVCCVIPVSAAPLSVTNDRPVENGSATTPVELTAAALNFSVTVPTSLPVHVAANGDVSVAPGAKIINKSAGKVKVTNVTVAGLNSWNLEAWSDTDDLSGKQVNTKAFALKLKEAGVPADGAWGSDFGTVDARNGSTNGELPFTYDAHVAPQAVAIDPAVSMAQVVFTIGWDT